MNPIYDELVQERRRRHWLRRLAALLKNEPYDEPWDTGARS